MFGQNVVKNSQPTGKEDKASYRSCRVHYSLRANSLDITRTYEDHDKEAT